MHDVITLKPQERLASTAAPGMPPFGSRSGVGRMVLAWSICARFPTPAGRKSWAIDVAPDGTLIERHPD
jgi:hypothetical protein